MRAIASLVMVLAAFPVVAGTMRVTVDVETAKAILSVAGRDVTDAEIDRIVALPGVQALIRHGTRFSPGQTDDNFRAALRALSANRDPNPDPFAFARLRQRLNATHLLLARIEKNPGKFSDDVIARMRPYAPDIDFEAKLTLIASGTSDGFAPGRGQLYVAIDYFQDDWDGLVVLAAHELYHAMQAMVMESSGVTARAAAIPGRTGEVTRLLIATLKEGTGSVVGDPLTVPKPGAYNSWFAEKYRRNLQRLPQNFALFETMLFRLANDDTPFGTIYPLGFSGGWDSPLYFVGYRMAKVIEKYDGRDAIQGVWKRSPAEFFVRYAALAREHSTDPDVIALNATTLKILESAARAYSGVM
jgi:hypothetical protein